MIAAAAFSIALITTMTVADAAQTRAPGKSAAKQACADAPRVAATPRRGNQVRPLTAEPPARHIATVYATRDGCPVVLVLDEGAPQWRAAPVARPRAAR